MVNITCDRELTESILVRRMRKVKPMPIYKYQNIFKLMYNLHTSHEVQEFSCQATEKKSYQISFEEQKIFVCGRH